MLRPLYPQGPPVLIELGLGRPQDRSENSAAEIHILSLKGFEPALPTMLSRLCRSFKMSKILVIHIYVQSCNIA
jgi:hypothetical protein